MYILKGRVIDGNGGLPIEQGAVVVDGEKILAVCDQKALEGKYPDAEVIEVPNGTILPGLIDLHLHGLLGKDFTDGNEADNRQMAKKLAEFGVTGFLPTVMTVPTSVRLIFDS